MAKFIELTGSDPGNAAVWVNVEQITFFRIDGKNTAIYFAAAEANRKMVVMVKENPVTILQRLN